MRRLVLLAVVTALAVPAHADAHHHGRIVPVCANRLCTTYLPGTPSCKRFKTTVRISHCFIVRAAHHWRQSWREAFRISYRESRWLPWAQNSSSSAGGLFQFLDQLWNGQTYRGYSRFSARWASLAAMRLWAHGLHCMWDPPGYCA